MRCCEPSRECGLRMTMRVWDVSMSLQREARKILLLAAAVLLVERAGLAGTIEGRVHSSDPTRNLRDFVIYIDDIEGPFPAPKAPAIMDQKGLRFVPHVLVVQAGTWVEFPNNDPVSHNVYSISEAKRFNLGLYPRGTVRRVLFDLPGVMVVLCNVHLAMSGYIVVLKNPFFAQTDSKGVYCIEDIPAGRHRLVCWHERFPVKERIVEIPETGTVTVDFFMGK